MNRIPPFVAIAMAFVVVAGCEKDDERLAKYAEESVRQQAGQNREMSQLNREVAQTHNELVVLQHDLEEQQADVNRQRDQLESERREIAEQRHRDPIIAAAINSIGLILACLIPLGLAGYLLHCLHNQKDDPVVSEFLIEEITSEQPMLLPPPRAEVGPIEDRRNPVPPSLTQADADQEVDSGD